MAACDSKQAFASLTSFHELRLTPQSSSCRPKTVSLPDVEFLTLPMNFWAGKGLSGPYDLYKHLEGGLCPYTERGASCMTTTPPKALN